MFVNPQTTKLYNYPNPCKRLIKPVEKINEGQIHNRGRYQQPVEHPTKGKNFDKKI